MIDLQSVGNLIAYSAQVTLIVVFCAVVAHALRLTAGAQFVFWRTLLALCLCLPILQPWRTMTAMLVGRVTTMESAAAAGARFTAATSWMLPWPYMLLIVIAAGATCRLAWTALGMIRLQWLRTAGVCADEAQGALDELQRAIGVRAEIRWVRKLWQPVTFGLRRPVVLLPESLRRQPVELQRAVIAHELLHVQRRDWAWVVSEEILRGLVWFHPAMWWLISRVQLAREAVVDELSVLATGDRRTYVKALLAFAEETSVSGATAFARRRHLFHRMLLISREVSVSSKRVVASCAVLFAAVAVSGWSAVSAFPLITIQPVARQSPPPPPAPVVESAGGVPRRLAYVAPQYPADAAAVAARGTATLEVTIDANGRVIACRATKTTASIDASKSPTDAYKAVIGNSFGSAAVEAVRQWQYEARSDAPFTFVVTVAFAPEEEWNAAEVAKALKIGGVIKPPVKTKDVKPVYPEAAKQDHVQGVVIVEALIGADGKVSAAHILRSIPPLDEAALEAVRQWEFRPTLMNGAPVPVLMTVTVNFIE